MWSFKTRRNPHTFIPTVAACIRIHDVIFASSSSVYVSQCALRRPPPLLHTIPFPFGSPVAVSRIIPHLCIFVGSGDKTRTHTLPRIRMPASERDATPKPIASDWIWGAVGVCEWYGRIHRRSTCIQLREQFLPFDDSNGTNNNCSWCLTHTRTYAMSIW